MILIRRVTNDARRRLVMHSRRIPSASSWLGGLLLVCLCWPGVAYAQANEEEYRRVVQMGLDALENRRLDESIAAFKRCLELKDKDDLCAYNLACAYSLKRELRTALDWLSRSIEWGFDDLEHMKQDADLDNLRGEPRYLSLVKRLEGEPDDVASDANDVLRTSELIVMLEGLLGGDPTLGAGIIFGRNADKIYIATARHNVRRGELAAVDLRIKLKSSPDEPLVAQATEHSDAQLDLAVLTATLPAARVAQFCTSTPLDVLADADVNRGDAVFPVGYPNGAPWGMPVAPDHIAQLVGNDITFQSAFISGGHSGGGLIAENGKLVGMIKADKQPFGVAVKLTRVLQTLRQWGYPVQLRAASNFLRTPLHQAIEKRDLAEVRRLAGACTHVNTMSDSGRTPLHMAAAAGWADAVRILVEAGAVVSAKTRGSPDSAGIQSFTPLHLAAMSGSGQAAQILIAHGADVKAHAFDQFDRDLSGTPLHYAAAAGAVEVIDVLLRAGADINAGSIDGPPLTFAVRRRNAAAARLLIERGAELNPNRSDALPLYVAVEAGATDMAKLLLESRADPNKEGTFGTPIHRAARHGHVEIVRLLLAAGADPNAISWEHTALHEAAEAGRIEIVKLLLDAGASTTARDRRGATPLDLAERAGHQAVVALLRGRSSLEMP